MKIRELIKELQKFPNQDAEVRVNHWLLLTKSDKVVLNWSKPTELLRQADGSLDFIVINTEQVSEDI